MSLEAVRIEIKQRETAEEVWALQHPAYRAEAALIGVAELPPLQDTIESLQSCGETFVGFRNADGELIGAASYEEDEGACTICRMMVHPKYHRQGIGKQVLERVLADRPEATVWKVTAEIRNLPAIALYESFGFVRAGSWKPIPEIELLKLVRAREL